jgi:response regulator RpfG family c-di-GMP phosphodiesterase
MAESAVDALELIEELSDNGHSIVLIVSDWLMPGMRGDEFLIKIHHKFPEVIKIMLSGQADEDAIERAFTQANLYKCIKKPWSEDELVGGICAAMGQFSRLKSH